MTAGRRGAKRLILALGTLAIVAAVVLPIVLLRAGDPGENADGGVDTTEALTTPGTVAGAAVTMEAAGVGTSEPLLTPADSNMSTTTPAAPEDEGFAALPLPDVARTIFQSPSTAALVAIVDAASLASVDDGTTARVEMRFDNQGGYDHFVAASDIQLIADGERVSAVGEGVLVGARAIESATFDFELTDVPEELVVRVYNGGDVGDIPLQGSSPEEISLVTEPQSAELGAATFEFGPPVQEVYSDRYHVGIPIHVVNNGGLDLNFMDNDFRLLIDGDPHEPVGVLNELVAPRSSDDATVWWEVPLGNPMLVLRVNHFGEEVELPVTPPPN